MFFLKLFSPFGIFPSMNTCAVPLTAGHLPISIPDLIGGITV